MTDKSLTFINSFISEGEQATISLHNLFETKLVTDIDDGSKIYRTTFDDFFLRHRDELNQLLQFWQVPQQMYYKPKAVSYQLYGTTELWLALLRANNMRNVTEFHYPYIRVYDPDQLLDIMRVYFKRENKI